MKAEGVSKTNTPKARDYLSVAYSRCSTGFPTTSEEYRKQQSIVDAYATKKPCSSHFLVFIALVGALIRHPGKTFMNCLKKIFTIN